MLKICTDGEQQEQIEIFGKEVDFLNQIPATARVVVTEIILLKS